MTVIPCPSAVGARIRHGIQEIIIHAKRSLFYFWTPCPILTRFARSGTG
jgi:hypothetical protein